MEISQESKTGSQNEGGFHNWLIKLIESEIIPTESRIFKSKIKQLKGLRVKADYKNEEIAEHKAKEAVSYAQEINRDTTKTFFKYEI